MVDKLMLRVVREPMADDDTLAKGMVTHTLLPYMGKRAGTQNKQTPHVHMAMSKHPRICTH